MGLDVVDRVERFIFQRRQGAGGQGADQQRPNQARRIGDGNGVDIVPGQVGVGQCLVDDGVDHFDVAASGHFGHDAAINRVNIDLRINDVT